MSTMSSVVFTAPELRSLGEAGVGHWVSSGSGRQEPRLYCTATQPRNTAEEQMKKKVLKKPQSSQPVPTETANRLRFFTERNDASPNHSPVWWKSNRPATTSRPWTNWERSWPAASKKSVAMQNSIVSRIRRPSASGLLRRARWQARAAAGAPRHGVSPGNAGHHCRAARPMAASGPGALDMKSGVALILHALEGLRACMGIACQAHHRASGFRRGKWQRFFPPHSESLARSRGRAGCWSPPTGRRGSEDGSQRRGRIHHSE